MEIPVCPPSSHQKRFESSLTVAMLCQRADGNHIPAGGVERSEGTRPILFLALKCGRVSLICDVGFDVVSFNDFV